MWLTTVHQNDKDKNEPI